MQVIPPEMAAAIAPAWLEEQDYPGARKIAEIAKKSLPPQLAAAYQDEKGGSAIPPELQAQLQQLQQENQQLQQALQSKQMEAQAKAQADLQKTAMQESGDMQRAQVDAQVQIQKAEIAANASIAVAELKMQSDDLTRRLKAVELFLTGEQQARLDRESRAHEAETQGRDHGHERVMAAMQHQQGMEAAAQSAAMQPDTDGDGQ